MKKYITLKLVITVCVVCVVHLLHAQDPTRFSKQVNKLGQTEYNFQNNNKLVLFVGSSSIVMWKDVHTCFPEYNVINNGFGGSHFSDLLYYYDKVILPVKPDIIFIYEGDNDIASAKKPKTIVKTAKKLITKIKTDMPGTKIILISPKPSIQRKKLAPEYIKLNTILAKLCHKQNLGFANVWDKMLDKDGNIFQDIFVSDGLHMNKKGYAIWSKVIGSFLQ